MIVINLQIPVQKLAATRRKRQNVGNNMASIANRFFQSLQFFKICTETMIDINEFILTPAQQRNVPDKVQLMIRDSEFQIK